MAITQQRPLTTEEEFKQAMIRFYRVCQLPEAKIEQIMTENKHEISKYLVATPELMARKFYEWTFNTQL